MEDPKLKPWLEQAGAEYMTVDGIGYRISSYKGRSVNVYELQDDRGQFGIYRGSVYTSSVDSRVVCDVSHVPMAVFTRAMERFFALGKEGGM